MEKIAQILFVVGSIAWFAWVIARSYLRTTYKPKADQAAPSDEEIRWHLRNMRQDLSMLAVTNFAVLLVLLYALVLKF